MGDSENRDNLVQELRRGMLVLAVLSQLGRQQYGYALLKLLGERGMEIDQGTLYPLLRRLEVQACCSPTGTSRRGARGATTSSAQRARTC